MARSGSRIAPIFASTALSPSAPPRNSWTRSFIATRSSSVNPLNVLADLCVAFFGLIETSCGARNLHPGHIHPVVCLYAHDLLPYYTFRDIVKERERCSLGIRPRNERRRRDPATEVQIQIDGGLERPSGFDPVMTGKGRLQFCGTPGRVLLELSHTV